MSYVSFIRKSELKWPLFIHHGLEMWRVDMMWLWWGCLENLMSPSLLLLGHILTCIPTQRSMASVWGMSLKLHNLMLWLICPVHISGILEIAHFVHSPNQQRWIQVWCLVFCCLSIGSWSENLNNVHVPWKNCWIAFRILDNFEHDMKCSCEV